VVVEDYIGQLEALCDSEIRDRLPAENGPAAEPLAAPAPEGEEKPA
jgi:hypothetical protein